MWSVVDFYLSELKLVLMYKSYQIAEKIQQADFIIHSRIDRRRFFHHFHW